MVFAPLGPAINHLFKFIPDEFDAPGKISLVTVLGCSKRLTRRIGEIRGTV
jgi:hypothetical protein